METTDAMKRKQGFCFLEISWVSGLFIDLLSFEINEVYHSLFCIYLSKEASFIELFGCVVMDTSDNELE